MNQLTKIWSSGHSEECTTDHDLLGRVSSRSSASGQSMSYAYDEWNRVTALKANGETTSYTYDSYGRLSTKNRASQLLR